MIFLSSINYPWSPLRAALVFWGFIVLGPPTLFSQPEPTARTTLAWQLTRKAESLIMDSLNWRSSIQTLARADSLMQGNADSAYWAESAFLRGRCLRRKGDFVAAIQVLEMPISYWKRHLEHPTERLGEALLVSGHCRLNLQQNDTALLYLQEALSVCLQSVGRYHFKTASVYNALGLLKEQVGEPSEAIDFYQQAIEIYSRIPPHAFASYSYANLGELYATRREFSLAIPYLKAALRARERYLPADHSEMFPLVRRLAYCLGESGDMDAATSMEQRALQIAGKRFGANTQEYAIVCSDLSFTSWSANQNLAQGAADAWQAVKILESIGKGKSENCANAYSNLASCYSQLGDKGKALRYHQKALQIRKAVFGDNDCEHTASSLLNLATAYASLKDYENAIRYDTEALHIRLANCEKYHPNTALIYNNIGNYYLQLGKDAETLKYLHLGEEIYFSPEVKGHFQAYTVLENLGWFYLKKRDFLQAESYFERAMAAIKSSYSGKNTLLANLTLELAQVRLAQNDYKGALSMADSALQVFHYNALDEQVNAQYFPLEADELKAEIYRRAFDAGGDSVYLRESRLLFRKTLDQVYHFALHFDESVSKSRLIFSHRSSFEQAILAECMGDSVSDAAFEYAERSKALILYQSICENGFWESAGIPDSMRQAMQQLDLEIAGGEKQRLEKLRSGFSAADTAVLSIDAVLLEKKQAREQIQSTLEREYPGYVSLKNQLQTVGPHWLQDSLLRQDEAFLEYFAGDSNLFLILVLKDRWLIKDIKLDFPLEEWIEHFRHGIFGYYTADASLQTDSLKNAALQEYLLYGAQLYSKLIAPVKNELPGRLIIAPDGPLGYLPFDALLTEYPRNINNFKTYPYLLQQYQISYAYSASFLKEMRNSKEPGAADHKLIAFAPYDQDETGLSDARKTSSGPGLGFTPLPYTKSEVEALCQLTGGDLLTGKAATREQFLAQAGHYRILHIATHGNADNHFGAYAFIAFAPAGDNPEHALVYIQDLYTLHLNADLVVLSACETGLGKWQPGEGIISIARAFAYAGARSVVTSLWAVNDKSTSDLMRYFYRELLLGKDKDEALRQARLHFLQDATVRNGHPFFWAAFVPLGDMRPVAP